jgi:hypothetical protein
MNIVLGQEIGSVTISKQEINRDKYGYIVYECVCSCGNIVYLSSSQLKRMVHPACKSCARGSKFKNLVGMEFGRWKVIAENYDSTRNRVLWLCRCNCGKEKSVTSNILTSGKSRSCGCLNYEKQCSLKIDLTNRRYGRLTVIKRGIKRAHWVCKCDCGNIVEIYSPSLYSGASISCGCFRSEGLSGENSIFWKNGATKQRNRKKDYNALSRWARHVKKRDNYECQCCLSKKLLHAHHILDFGSYPEFRFKEDNGITLCKICHENFHKEFSSKKNDRTQLLEFLRRHHG